MIRLKIREIIKEKNINQSKLSRMSDIPINTIQSMVRNEFHDPRLSTLERIANALDLQIEELYEVIKDHPAQHPQPPE